MFPLHKANAPAWILYVLIFDTFCDHLSDIYRKYVQNLELGIHSIFLSRLFPLRLSPSQDLSRFVCVYVFVRGIHLSRKWIRVHINFELWFKVREKKQMSNFFQLLHIDAVGNRFNRVSKACPKLDIFT